MDGMGDDKVLDRIDFHVHLKAGDAFIPENLLIKKIEKENLKVVLLEHDELPKLKHENVICAEEVSADCCHVIAIGINEKIEPGPLEEVLEKIKEQGGKAIIAHFGRYLELGKILKKFDAIEAVNARTRMENNVLAFLKVKDLGIPLVGGSDAHFINEIGKVITLGDFEALKDGKIVVEDVVLNEPVGFWNRFATHLLSTIRDPKKFPNKVKLAWKKMLSF